MIKEESLAQFNVELLQNHILKWREENPNFTQPDFLPTAFKAMREGNPYLFVIYPKVQLPVSVAFAGVGMGGLATNIIKASLDQGNFNPDLMEMAYGIIENQLGEIKDSEKGISHARALWRLGQEAEKRAMSAGLDLAQIQFNTELLSIGERYRLRMNMGLGDCIKGLVYAATMEASGAVGDNRDGWMGLEFKFLEQGCMKLDLPIDYSRMNHEADERHGLVMCNLAIQAAHFDNVFNLPLSHINNTIAECYEDRGKFWYDLSAYIDQNHPYIWNL